VLIVCFVIVVIGGIGSIKGAFVAALQVGLADTFGKASRPASPASPSTRGTDGATLLLRPQGCSGGHPDGPLRRAWSWSWPWRWLAVLLLLPASPDRFYVQLFTKVMTMRSSP